MREIGEQRENKMLEEGKVTAQDLQDARFVKVAMIERTMHFIQEKAKATTGKEVWNKEEYGRVLKSASAKISIVDIAEAKNMSAKTAIILKELRNEKVS